MEEKETEKKNCAPLFPGGKKSARCGGERRSGGRLSPFQERKLKIMNFS